MLKKKIIVIQTYYEKADLLFLFRLKEMLLKERSDRAGLQTRLQELEERYRSAVEQLEQVRNREEQHKRALCILEDSMSQAEALRVQQRAEEVEEQPSPVVKHIHNFNWAPMQCIDWHWFISSLYIQ